MRSNLVQPAASHIAATPGRRPTAADPPAARPAPEPAVDHSLVHVLGRLDAIVLRVRAAVATRRRGDPEPDDPFRGLYVSDDLAERLLEGPGRDRTTSVVTRPATTEGSTASGLARDGPADTAALEAVEATADAAEEDGAVLRLRRLAAVFRLDARDLELLLITLAPDVDPRLERLYGYLNDDVTRRRATVALALELSGLSPASAADRARLHAQAPLRAGNLVTIEECERPFPGRELRVPDRVTAHLLGEDRADASLAHVLHVPVGESSPAPGSASESSASDRRLRVAGARDRRRRGPRVPHRAPRHRCRRGRPGCAGGTSR